MRQVYKVSIKPYKIAALWQILIKLIFVPSNQKKYYAAVIDHSIVCTLFRCQCTE